MAPPHNPGGPGRERLAPAGWMVRLLGWCAPVLGASLVLTLGSLWILTPTEAWILSRTERIVVIGGLMVVVVGLMICLQVRVYRSARRLQATEQSLRFLSDALLQAHREMEHYRESEQALRDADRSKDEFLATLCHELRNPLAAIDHAGELLIDLDDDQEQREWAVRIIRNQTRQLALLIDDLLDLSRIAKGTLTLNLRPASLAHLVRSAVDAARSFLEDAHQRVVFQISDEPMWVEVDPSRIQQVLINLLSNACRYSDPGKSITISVQASKTEVVFSVKDQGIGIDPALMPRIFGMFIRGDAARDRSPSGLGIGLRLVKLIVERHGGTILARSDGIGHGSEFEIRLPKIASPPHLSTASNPELSATLPRLLLVDDNRPMVEALRLLLQREGHEVRIARTGRDAIEAVAIERPDVILLDLELPDTDGIELAQAIRSNDHSSCPPIIALTGSGRPVDLEGLQQAGIRVLIQKPVRIDELRETLARISREGAGTL
ncbi:hybrid sensor histidine kinase/response regulator [Tautonia marina]|uniref:hybrid sensor histidine kinase/response regulator n=1 Tax=Tautonia marina TaxID=2653855 RepID=UPI001260A863|nr:hybrid sensor histidine kinase/response regulator [Tautonia marina]